MQCTGNREVVAKEASFKKRPGLNYESHFHCPGIVTSSSSINILLAAEHSNILVRLLRKPCLPFWFFFKHFGFLMPKINGAKFCLRVDSEIFSLVRCSVTFFDHDGLLEWCVVFWLCSPPFLMGSRSESRSSSKKVARPTGAGATSL